MYEFIRGILTSADEEGVVLDALGVGYRLKVSARTRAGLPALGQQLLLYCVYIFRDPCATLFGFLTEGERTAFEHLTSVSGIGPKMALGILGTLTLPQLRQAIYEENAGALAKVPGIGKKTAERLVLELRDKLASLLHFEASGHAAPTLPKAVGDATCALVNLGYSRSSAEKAIQMSLERANDKGNVEELIRHALQVI